jgi:hypothetical protein
VQVQHIDEKKITWRKFKRYFQKKYLTKCYYDNKMKDLFELKLGSMTIDEYERRFLELLKYVSFIKDEQVKIQRYLSGMPSIFSDKIQYDDPKTLDETIRRDKCLYDQHRGRPNFPKGLGRQEERKDGAEEEGEPSHHSSEIILRDNRNVGVVREITCTGIVPHRDEKVRIVHNVQKLIQ